MFDNINIIDELRKRGLFGMSSPTTPDQGVLPPPRPMDEIPRPISPDNGGDMDIISHIQSMFQPQTDSQDRLRQLLAEQPHKDDPNLKPGFFRKLAAGAVAGGDTKLADQWANKKYYAKEDEWEGQIKPINDLANSERANNSNQRMMANQMVTSELRQKELDRRTEADKKNYDAKIENINQRDRYLAFKQYQHDNPNHVFKIDNSGKVYAVNPQTDEVNYLSGNDGGYLLDKDLPEVEKLKIQNQNRLGQIAAQGGETRKNITTQGGVTAGNIVKRGEVQKDVEANRPVKAAGAGAVKSDTPSMQQYTQANKVYNTHPELQPYITMDHKLKTFRVSMPPKGGNEAMRKKAADLIYNMNTTIQLGQGNTPDKPPAGAKAGGKWIQTKYGPVYQEP